MSIKGINSKAELLNFIRNYLQEFDFQTITSSNGTIHALTCSNLLVEQDPSISGAPSYAVIGDTNRLYFRTPEPTNNLMIYGQDSGGRLNISAPTLISLTPGEVRCTLEPATDWTAVSFETNWEDYSPLTFGECSYFKDSAGFVHLRGRASCANGTTPGTTIFVLPSGYRPAYTGIYACRSGTTNDYTGTTCQVLIHSVGWVVVSTDFTPASDNWVSLSGITFDTRS